jgi:hypothetical protein
MSGQPAMLGFLHTADVQARSFEALLRELDGAVRSRHLVDEGLLAEARAAGGVTPALAGRIAAAIGRLAAEGASVVLCTCSTIAAAAEATAVGPGVVVLRVDRPMAERAVVLGSRIAVVAALASALGPTVDLLREVAARAGRSVEIAPFVCESAWAHFERGDTGRYRSEVARAIEAAARLGDVVVLAQASMAAAADLVPGLGVPVLSSPRLGVEAALRAVTPPSRPSAGSRRS